jgi:hypothetical protein
MDPDRTSPAVKIRGELVWKGQALACYDGEALVGQDES